MACFLTPAQLRALPVCFAGHEVQDAWLQAHGTDEACRLFDEFGYVKGWLRLSAVAEAFYPDLSPSARCNKLRAVVLMVVAGGKVTGSPQVWYRHGRISFEAPA